MKITCSGCNTIHSIPEDKLPDERRKAKCKKCGGLIMVPARVDIDRNSANIVPSVPEVKTAATASVTPETNKVELTRKEKWNLVIGVMVIVGWILSGTGFAGLILLFGLIFLLMTAFGDPSIFKDDSTGVIPKRRQLLLLGMIVFIIAFTIFRWMAPEKKYNSPSLGVGLEEFRNEFNLNMTNAEYKIHELRKESVDDVDMFTAIFPASKKGFSMLGYLEPADGSIQSISIGHYKSADVPKTDVPAMWIEICAVVVKSISKSEEKEGSSKELTTWIENTWSNSKEEMLNKLESVELKQGTAQEKPIANWTGRLPDNIIGETKIRGVNYTYKVGGTRYHERFSGIPPRDLQGFIHVIGA